MKTKIILLIMLILVLVSISSCKEPESKKSPIEKFLGEAVVFEAEQGNISINDSIVIASANYTGEIYLLNFCGVPFNLLQKQEVGWKYIYPDYKECAEPTNITFTPGMATKLSDIDMKNSIITPGLYMARVYYSTFGPMKYLREYNIIIDIN